MQPPNSSSLFHDIKTRELDGFRVRKRPYISDLSSDSGGLGTGVLAIEHDSVPTPPLAVSFCKESRNCHFLAISDEDGYVSFYDTRRKLPDFTSCRENAGEARVHDWVAHKNAIFDVCWIKDDTHILTASGDQTIKIWDVEKRRCIGVMMEHTGSVKSLSSHPSNPYLVISGSRDGSFALWDLRSRASTNRNGRACLKSFAIVKGAHIPTQGKRVRRGKATNKSVTSVLYLKDEISIASAGSADSIVKFWDTRNLKAPIMQTHSHFAPPIGKTEKCSLVMLAHITVGSMGWCGASAYQLKAKIKNERGMHGISSLSQDSNGVFLAASCRDNRIYLYNVLQLDKGPLRTFSGSQIESFYVKSAISPDATYILGGSSDGNAYMWQVNKPEVSPIVLKGHGGEVTAVDWCPSESGKVATSSDDFMVRIWNIQRSICSNSRSPSCIRRRIIAFPDVECERLSMNKPPLNLESAISSPSPPVKTPVDHQTPSQTKTFEIHTPESLEKGRFAGSFLKEPIEMQKTPEAAFKSPSSVLSPPPSLKRTIRDYFAAAS